MLLLGIGLIESISNNIIYKLNYDDLMNRPNVIRRLMISLDIINNNMTISK